MSAAADLFNLTQQQPQAGFEFPESLTEKYRPSAIADFVGLEKPKKIMRKLAANPFPSAWMFLGPSGTGKTTMALAFAAEINAELHHIPSQDCNLEKIERVRRICQYVPMAGCKFHLVLVDEADQMNRPTRSTIPVPLSSSRIFKLWHQRGSKPAIRENLDKGN